MTSTKLECIRCNPANRGDSVPIGSAGYICDRCIELVNHPGRHRRPGDHRAPPPPASERKSSKRRHSKRATGAALLLALLLPLAGCTIAWQGQLKLNVDPSPALQLQRPFLPPAPAGAAPAATES